MPRTRPPYPPEFKAEAVFVNRRRVRQTARNVQARMKVAIQAANKRLDGLEVEPISGSVSPHSLRRTFASLRVALRDDPVYIAEQLGHEDARFTFRVYQRAAKRRSRLSGAYAIEFDRALEWASLATSESSGGKTPARSLGEDARPERDHVTRSL